MSPRFRGASYSKPDPVLCQGCDFRVGDVSVEVAWWNGLTEHRFLCEECLGDYESELRAKGNVDVQVWDLEGLLVYGWGA